MVNAETVDGGPRRLISKSDYARMHGRTPQAVSKWIAQGKLKPPALVGSGVKARIDVGLANQMLAQLLDLGQQLAQPAPILPPAASVPLAALSLAPTAAPPAAEPVDDDNRRRLRARADREEAEARAAIRKELAENGRWLLAAEAASTWRRELTDLLGAFDVWVPLAAEELAGEFGIDPRLATVKLRQSFRALRQRLAAAAVARRDALPESMSPDGLPGAGSPDGTEFAGRP